MALIAGWNDDSQPVVQGSGSLSFGNARDLGCVWVDAARSHHRGSNSSGPKRLGISKRTFL